MLIALPFLGGVDQCRGPDPEPEPDPELCLADAACGADAWCNTELCIGPTPVAGDVAELTVCYGVCEPRPATCEPVTCELYCGAGLATDDRGCEVCSCVEPPPPPPVCLPVACTLACEFGWSTDDDGCPTCACAEPPPPPTCGDVECALHCEYGFALGDDGCPTCTCAEPPPPTCEGLPALCEVCEYGFVVDERGCETCECAEPPGCEPVFCDIFCEDGLAIDERGCEICACTPPPSERRCGGFAGLTCDRGEFCDYDSTVPACGAADHLGTCRPRPEACYEIYAPVCGCDGRTYENDCYANAGGTDIAAAGTCESPSPGL